MVSCEETEDAFYRSPGANVDHSCSTKPTGRVPCALQDWIKTPNKQKEDFQGQWDPVRKAWRWSKQELGHDSKALFYARPADTTRGSTTATAAAARTKTTTNTKTTTTTNATATATATASQGASAAAAAATDTSAGKDIEVTDTIVDMDAALPVQLDVPLYVPWDEQARRRAKYAEVLQGKLHKRQASTEKNPLCFERGRGGEGVSCMLNVSHSILQVKCTLYPSASRRLVEQVPVNQTHTHTFRQTCKQFAPTI